MKFGLKGFLICNNLTLIIYLNRLIFAIYWSLPMIIFHRSAFECFISRGLWDLLGTITSIKAEKSVQILFKVTVTKALIKQV